MQRLHQVDIPPPKYYAALDVWRRKAFPNASPEVHEHFGVLEEFFDVCISSGFSLGASKSLGKLFQPQLEFLGDVVGRHGLQSTEAHLDAVKYYGDITNPEGMRRFLGAFGWVRKSYPKEAILGFTAIVRTAQEGRHLADAGKSSAS